MKTINLMATRHSAFYSPFIACIAGGFLEKEGLQGTYQVVPAGTSTAAEIASGRMDVGQSAVSQAFGPLEKGEKPPVAHFAQINRYDGFIIAARESDPSFSWSKLKSKNFLHVHGGQPEAMLRYALYKEGVDLDELDRIESKGGEQMMQQWLDGEGDYFHEQGAYPQQLEHIGKGHIVAAVGPSIGPVAFSSLVCRWDWIDSDDAKKFANAYRAARHWVNTADPMEVAKAEASFFPDMAVEATAAAVAFYQKLDNWGGDIAIDPQHYERTLDVFSHSKRISKRHDYDAMIISPPQTD
ncbi:MAG: ABC transporter substrate-binding protein [Betaproteobacteria bacterium]|nr:MAG: ABC transporter substrate-binding protein [Betaproteobacteria bacterium]